MRMETAAAAAFAFVLAGCGSEPSEPQEPAAGAQVGKASETTAPASTATETANGFASNYTAFDLAACEILSENREEGSSADYRCPGYADMPLLVQEGDGRFDLDAGIDDGGFQTLGAFNEIADRIEWRTREGEPFAVIFRFRDVAGIESGRTVLAVETVGREGAPGCRLAQIAGDTPEANARARAIADSAAGGISACPEKPRMVGNAA